MSSGRNISRLYIMSRSLLVYKISFFGSTPGSTIPLLWEYSCKSGPTHCFFSTGVLPEALQHFCGSNPRHALRVVEITSINKFFCLRICTILTEALSEPVYQTWPESHKKFKDKICSTNIVKNCLTSFLSLFLMLTM